MKYIKDKVVIFISVVCLVFCSNAFPAAQAADNSNEMMFEVLRGTGIINPDTDDFGEGEYVTRQQFAVFLSRAIALEITSADSEQLVFSDVTADIRWGIIRPPQA